jgi:phosphocarrier protein
MIEKKKLRKYITILNDKGLHTRPATELVKCASMYKAELFLHYQGLSVNAKSLLGILMLAAARGAKITLEAEGDDAEEAIAALADLVKSKFHMSY